LEACGSRSGSRAWNRTSIVRFRYPLNENTLARVPRSAPEGRLGARPGPALAALDRSTALVISAAAYNTLSLWELRDALYREADADLYADKATRAAG
jgi:hypothetical protein